jgi:single-stranded DNA-specific DHH superfamily exonuclease
VKRSPGHRPGICSVSGDRIWLKGTTLEEVEETHRATLLLALEETNQKYAALEAIQDAEAERKRLEREAHEQHVREAAKKITF